MGGYVMQEPLNLFYYSSVHYAFTPTQPVFPLRVASHYFTLDYPLCSVRTALAFHTWSEEEANTWHASGTGDV